MVLECVPHLTERNYCFDYKLQGLYISGYFIYYNMQIEAHGEHFERINVKKRDLGRSEAPCSVHGFDKQGCCKTNTHETNQPHCE